MNVYKQYFYSFSVGPVFSSGRSPSESFLGTDPEGFDPLSHSNRPGKGGKNAFFSAFQLTFWKSKFASGIFAGQDFSTRIRRRISRLRAVFPVFDGVRLALESSEKCLGSERSLQGMRRGGRVGSSGQVREARCPPLVCGGLSQGGGGGCFPRRVIRSPGSL